MEIKDIKAVYFVGAGGIGMSAIARYFIHKGIVVAGYDKTPSELTHQLEREGVILHYKESVEDIPHACRKPESCLVRQSLPTTRNWYTSVTMDSQLKSELKFSEH